MGGARVSGRSQVKPVTLRDVAAVAEVSISTASKVLNGTGRVAPSTRERILEAAERLEFRPNALAKSFATGRSLTVGVLTKSALSTFSMPVLIGANGAFGAADMATLMYDANVDHDRYFEHINKLQSRHVDGLLVVGSGLGTPLRSVSEHFKVPVVYAFGFSESDQDISFVPNSRMAGRLAGEHLIGLGRTRIAHITAANDLSADERAGGLQSALDDAGLDLVFGAPLRGDWTRDWGAAAVQRMLDIGEPFDALFCGDDWIAYGAQAAVLDAGLRVPEDVAIVGFDNIGGLVQRPGNSLTTIDPSLSQLGAAAATHLLDIMSGEPLVPGFRYHDCVLIDGRSTLGSAAFSHADIDPLSGV